MKITNVRVEHDEDTFAPVVLFDGELSLEMANTQMVDEAAYFHDLGLTVVNQIRNELAKQR